MAEYIEREAVLSLAKKGYLVSNGNYGKVCKLINDIPSADVVPKEQYEQDRKEWLDRYIKEHDARIKTIKDYHDYQPLVHGHWEEKKIINQNANGYFVYSTYIVQARCSVCQRYSTQLVSQPKVMVYDYCPRCGAKLD